MKARTFLATISFLILCNATFAQGYHIRITYNTNLRASHSTSSHIVETASAGTVLHVTGSQERWLHINRNGQQVWMASWVGHTRVDAPAPAQEQAEVDNCCFVDRQCNTDQEWTNGYNAYQNNQCPVTQPVSRQVAAQSTGLPPIHGSASCQAAIRKAFERIKSYPRWRSHVQNHQPASVSCELSSSGGRYYTNRRDVVINPLHIPYPVIFESNLVHEYCHVRQQNEGRPVTDVGGECYQVTLDYVNTVSPSNWGLKNQLIGWIRQEGG